MRKEITVAAEVRTSRGKNEARRTRRAGHIPAVIYGSFQEPVSIAVNPREISKIIHSNTGYNTIFNLVIQGGETTPVMLVDRQVDPVKGTLLHADFKRIDLTKRLRVSIPVHTAGEAAGREGAGRAARGDHARHRNRMPAGRDSGRVHGGCHRVDDRPGQARQRRGAFRLHEAGELGRHRHRACGGAARRGSRRAHRRRSRRAVTPEAGATPAEPEVIKKGKKEEEAPAEEKEKGKKK